MPVTSVARPGNRGSPGTRRRVRQRGRHASSYGDGFGRFAGITFLSLLPGAGLFAVGRRKLGLFLLLLTGLGVATLAVLAFSGGIVERVLAVAVRPGQLLTVAGVFLIIGAVWCLTIVATAWRARPERPSRLQTVGGVLLVAGLCFAVVLPTWKGASYAMIQRGLVTSLFASEGANNQALGAARPNVRQSDPWKNVPRVNLLLLGSDAGADRTGVRTDSMIVASINTKTGDTTLIGLPRNLQNVPFPATSPLHAVWPQGFDCGDQCLLNAVWSQATVVRPDLFKGVPNPGLVTTRGVISEIVGLRIDAYTIIDLRGFQSLVNAMGGVEVNVPRDIPIGGADGNPITGYIKAGQRRLNGYEALWFSRSRVGADDYDRMLRQRCMVGNLVAQVNPVSLLAKYPQLASVAKQNISTDVPKEQLQAWVVLVQRMQKAKIRSLPLTNKVIDTANPDFAKIRQLVDAAINPKPATPTTPSATTHSPSPTTTAPQSATAQDLRQVC